MSALKELERLRVNETVRLSGGKEYEDSLNRISRQLNGLKDKEVIHLSSELEKNASALLSPADDTLLYAFLLSSKVKTSRVGQINWRPDSASGESLWGELIDFLRNFDPIEIRFAGSQWRYLVETVIEATYQVDEPEVQSNNLERVTAALLRLDPAGTTFTTTYLFLARCALSLQLPQPILPLLDKELTNLPTSKGVQVEGMSLVSQRCHPCVYISQKAGFTEKLKLEDIQEYFVLGALVYVSLSRWDRALLFLEYVLSTPASNAATGYMVEAYRKWTLINLVSTGHLPRMPSTVTQNSLKQIQGVSKPYQALVDAFTKDNYAKLLAEVITGTQLWAQDGNVGLVQRMLAEYRRRSVLKLGSVFTAVPLNVVAERLRISQSSAEKYLTDLVSSGKIHAQLDRPNNNALVLRFLEDLTNSAPGISEVELRDMLVKRTNRLRHLADAIRQADEALSRMPSYLDHEKQRRSQMERQNNAKEDADMIDIAGQQASDDEELMAEAGDKF